MTEEEKYEKFLIESGELPYNWRENNNEIETNPDSPFYGTSLKDHESFGK